MEGGSLAKQGPRPGPSTRRLSAFEVSWALARPGHEEGVEALLPYLPGTQAHKVPQEDGEEPHEAKEGPQGQTFWPGVVLGVLPGGPGQDQ